MSSRPFEIRAHHLDTFGKFLRPGWSPASYAQYLVLLRKIEKNGTAKGAYAEDVIGTSEADAGNVQTRFEAVFNKFVNWMCQTP